MALDQGALPRLVGHITPEAFRVAARLAMAELMMSGCTCASDHHYLFPAGMENSIDVEAEEAAALGMRVTLTRGALDLRGGDGEQAVAPPHVVQDTDVILADCERLLSRYHDASDGGMTQVALAPNALFDVSFRLLEETARLSARHNCALHTHLVETRAEADFVRATHHCDAVDFLESCGWLNDRVWLAHAIHFDDAEIGRLGRHGVGICHCPTSNMLLASGICRTRELEQAGCKVGLGVDGSASNDNSNLMEGVRHALLIGRLRYPAEDITHLDVLRWATQGSARCLNRTDIGEIAVGKQADLAFLHPRRIALLGRRRSDRGAGAVRRPSGRPRHGQGPLDGRGGRSGGPRPRAAAPRARAGRQGLPRGLRCSPPTTRIPG